MKSWIFIEMDFRGVAYEGRVYCRLINQKTRTIRKKTENKALNKVFNTIILFDPFFWLLRTGLCCYCVYYSEILSSLFKFFEFKRKSSKHPVPTTAWIYKITMSNIESWGSLCLSSRSSTFAIFSKRNNPWPPAAPREPSEALTPLTHSDDTLLQHHPWNNTTVHFLPTIRSWHVIIGKWSFRKNDICTQKNFELIKILYGMDLGNFLITIEWSIMSTQHSLN